MQSCVLNRVHHLRDGTECKSAKLETRDQPVLKARMTLKEGTNQVKRMIAASAVR